MSRKQKRNVVATPLSREALKQLFVDSVNLFDAEEATSALDQAWTTKNNTVCVLDILIGAIMTCTRDLVCGVNADWFIDVVRTFLREVRIDIDAICFMDNLCILHVCVWLESIPWVHFLVREKNANVNQLSLLPPTIISPLSVAIVNIQRSINDAVLLPIIDILLNNGADVENTFLVESENWDYLKLAVESRNFATVQALVNHMDKQWNHRYREMINLSKLYAYRLIDNDRDNGSERDHQLAEMAAFMAQLLATRRPPYCFETCPIVEGQQEQENAGLMVMCDNRKCLGGKWFHFGCAFGGAEQKNITRQEVAALHTWCCPDCNGKNRDSLAQNHHHNHSMTTRRKHKSQ